MRLTITIASLFITACIGCNSDDTDCRIDEVKQLLICPDGSTWNLEGQDGANGKDGEPGQDGQDAMVCEEDEMFRWTDFMLYDWQQAEYWRIHCLGAAELRHHTCTQNGLKTCDATFKSDQDSCNDGYARNANRIPERACDTSIFTIPWGAVEEDYDGDGLSNVDEFYMGLNVCTQNTLGCNQPSDGQLDYDDDGLENAVDARPRCPVTLDDADCV